MEPPGTSGKHQGPSQQSLFCVEVQHLEHAAIHQDQAQQTKTAFCSDKYRTAKKDPKVNLGMEKDDSPVLLQLAWIRKTKSSPINPSVLLTRCAFICFYPLSLWQCRHIHIGFSGIDHLNCKTMQLYDTGSRNIKNTFASTPIQDSRTHPNTSIKQKSLGLNLFKEKWYGRTTSLSDFRSISCSISI